MERIQLPEPKTKGQVSIEEAIANRRSVRGYKDEPLTLAEISQLVWAAQGITDSDLGKRSAPSAGGIYPVEIYVVVQNVEGLEAGVYHYVPAVNVLEEVFLEEVSERLSGTALGQDFIAEAPVNLIVTGNAPIVMEKYGNEGMKYTNIEIGHVSQNIYLQAEGLGLGTVTIGALNEEAIRHVLDLPSEHTPHYIMPVGKK